MRGFRGRGFPALPAVPALSLNGKESVAPIAFRRSDLYIALLIGLLLNGVANWRWADPAAAFVITAFALREGRESWRSNACDCG